MLKLVTPVRQGLLRGLHMVQFFSAAGSSYTATTFNPFHAVCKGIAE